MMRIDVEGIRSVSDTSKGTEGAWAALLAWAVGKAGTAVTGSGVVVTGTIDAPTHWSNGLPIVRTLAGQWAHGDVIDVWDGDTDDVPAIVATVAAYVAARTLVSGASDPDGIGAAVAAMLAADGWRDTDDGLTVDDARCPACGEIIDYCQGHGEIGDPDGRAILDSHDADDHTRCHPAGCEAAEILHGVDVDGLPMCATEDPAALTTGAFNAITCEACRETL